MSKKTKFKLPEVWIDEIPTQGSTAKAVTVSLATFMLFWLGAYLFWFGPEFLEQSFPAEQEVSTEETQEKKEPSIQDMDVDDLTQDNTTKTETAPPETAVAPEDEKDDEEEEMTTTDTRLHLESVGYFQIITLLPYIFGGLGALCGLAGILSFLRIKITRLFLRITIWLVYPIMIGYSALMWMVIFDLLPLKLPFGSSEDKVTALKFWWELSWPAFAIFIYAVWLNTMLRSRSVYVAFTSQEGSPMEGDRVLEDFRTHGRDPRARKSLYGSAFTHWFFLVLLPFLMTLRGCVEPYRPPKGAGDNAVPVQVVKVKKKKKKKQLKLRKDSAIILEIPPLDDIDKIVEEMTEVVYDATAMKNAKSGTPGKGGGKGPPGWPEGQEGAEIRFIRLSHAGYNWNDGMGKTNADKNFMREFQRVTRFKKVRKYGESHPISHLALYPDDGFPPFVFMTGDGPIRGVGGSDIKILREYCEKGGMLIGDAGSGSFDRSFRDLMRRVFPGKTLLNVADDDRLYQLPFNFPNGAPSFWSHGGTRGMGIKQNNRWMVFYHPGDMNDAWKSSGYSKVSPEMRRNAYNLGINIVFYAFNEWNDAVAKKRK